MAPCERRAPGPPVRKPEEDALMTDKKRVFLIVLDSFGCGAAPDAAAYGDAGSNTLAACAALPTFSMPALTGLGLFNIQGVGCGVPEKAPRGAFGRMAEASSGKDTTTGHWELAGLVSKKPMPTYPDGFPQALIDEYARRTGHKILCNKACSGTKVIREYGREQIETRGLIVYTSADSVFQVAAHTDAVPLEELYRCCKIARELLTGEHGVGRVIARPFVGTWPDYTRTAQRHDYSLEPPGMTMLDLLSRSGLDVIGVGKIGDIFAGRGLTESLRTLSNEDGMDKVEAFAARDFCGLCFANLVDFDTLYGHRNDAEGYARALSAADRRIARLMQVMREEDILIVTADHGCDPSTASTDHSREYVPLLLWGKRIRPGTDLGTRQSFADTAATLLDYFGVREKTAGESFLREVLI